MSETKHTPGPWHQARFTNMGHEQTLATVVGPDNEPIAHTFSISRSHHERLANARSIAALPDLLAALEVIVKVDDDGSEDEPFVYDNMMRQARDAIAKAKGVEL